MSTFRKMKRQQARTKAQCLSDNGKHGKKSRLFKMIWCGQQKKEKEKKQDEQIEKLLEAAKKQQNNA